MSNSLNCEKCGSPMAPAEALCHACGQPAPEGRAARFLAHKADQSAQDGQWNLASSQLRRAVESGLPAAEQAVAWRKIGLWHEKNLGASPLEAQRAEEAYRKSLEMDFEDEITHQLFQSFMYKMGRLALAEAYYAQVLAKQPEQPMALKQAKLARLMADTHAKPVVAKLDLGEQRGLMARAFKPSPMKYMVLGLNAASSLLGLLFALFHQGGPAPEPAGLEGVLPQGGLSLMSSLGDPWIWFFSFALSAGLMFVLWRNR